MIEIDGKQVFRELSESGHPAVPVVEIGGDVAVPVGAFDPRFAAAAHGETLDARSLRSR